MKNGGSRREGFQKEGGRRSARRGERKKVGGGWGLGGRSRKGGREEGGWPEPERRKGRRMAGGGEVKTEVGEEKGRKMWLDERRWLVEKGGLGESCARVSVSCEWVMVS